MFLGTCMCMHRGNVSKVISEDARGEILKDYLLVKNSVQLLIFL